MTRQGGVVEQIGALLDEGCAPDEIGVLLAMDEHEVRRIAQLLDERGPADPAPDVDVQAVAAEVETLPDVDGTPALYADDVRPLLGKVQGPAMARQALVTIADHVDHLDDVRDIASMLGLGPALDDWTPRASEPVENHDTHEPEQPPVVASYVVPAPLVEAFAEQDEQRAASTVLDGVQRARQRLAEHVASYAAPVDVDADYVHEVHSAAIVLPGPAPDPDEQPEHVHDVGPAWDEDGTPYALCATCGHRWDRQPCDICGLPVTGLVIAQDGRARHRHHRPEAS